MGDQVALASSYTTGVLSKDAPTEFERIHLLQDWIDPATREVLSAVGVDPAARCLEIGAGAGSVALWLAERCAAGSVTAVDIDTRYLDGLDVPNLRVRRGDIRTMSFEPGSFDLIHARMTFCHLSNRDQVLAEVAKWLAPGGRLVVGDPYSFPAQLTNHPLRKRYLAGLTELWRAQGTDLTWAPVLPARMAEAGLRNIGTRVVANSVGDGSAYDRFTAVNMRQHCTHLVERGLLSEGETEELMAQLDDPAFVELHTITVYAWGQRPGLPGPRE